MTPQQRIDNELETLRTNLNEHRHRYAVAVTGEETITARYWVDVTESRIKGIEWAAAQFGGPISRAQQAARDRVWNDSYGERSNKHDGDNS